jgi:hypothetical protein
MGLDPIDGPKGGQDGGHLRPIETLAATSATDEGNGERSGGGTMAGYEIVGLALLVLFVGSLVSSKQSISR